MHLLVEFVQYLESFVLELKFTSAESHIGQYVPVFVHDGSSLQSGFANGMAQRISIMVINFVNPLGCSSTAGCLKNLFCGLYQTSGKQLFNVLKRNAKGKVVENVPDMNRKAVFLLPAPKR